MDFKFTCSILSAYILPIYQYPDLAKYAALTSSGLCIIVFLVKKLSDNLEVFFGRVSR